MSKRAEEAALKAYPYSPTEVNLFGHKTITTDGNSCDRAKYRSGYEQAEKDIKDALLDWLYGKAYEHNEDRFDDGFNAAMGQVIDKINSL